MQKWCPEPLVVDGGGGGHFMPLVDAASADATAVPTGFRPEAGFADSGGLLAALSRDERSQIVELIEQDLRREYEQRYQQEETERAAQAAAAEQADAEALERWHAELAEGLSREIEAALDVLAGRMVEIARLMAEKLVRREVAVEPEILSRTLETVLYKIAAGCPLTVTVHPDDAAWLKAKPDLCTRLHIQDIKDDRRLARGGALVAADGQEWEATISRQLDVLVETIEDALTVPVTHDTVAEDDDA